MISIRFSIYFISITTVCGLSITESNAVPNITLLATPSHIKKNSLNMSCVAGPDVQGSAITFITPLTRDYVMDTPVSTYRSSQGLEYEDEYNCNFESESGCVSKWTQVQSNNSIGMQHLTATWEQDDIAIIAPVTDSRWESNAEGNYTTHTFSRKIHSIDISVRTNGEPIILLYDEKGDKYYRIHINKNNIILNVCPSRRSITDIIQTNHPCNNLGHTNGKGLAFNESIWINFKLILLSQHNTGKVIAVKGLDNNNILLNTKSKNIKKIFLHIGNNETGLWKIHDNNYLSLPYYEQWQYLGPTLKPDNAGTLCVELYVAICFTCALTLQVFDVPETNVTVVENNNLNMQNWHLIRLHKRNVMLDKNFTLQVLTENSDISQGFWLIDDVRRCYDDETRVISIKVPMHQSDIVSCHALQQPKWWSSFQIGRTEQSDFAVCDNATYTGSRCSISCVSTLGTNCSNIIVCEPSMNRTLSKCTCTAGYQGDQWKNVRHQTDQDAAKRVTDVNNIVHHQQEYVTHTYTDVSSPNNLNIDSYSTTVSEKNAFSPALYSLLLLLLLLIIPAIGWFAYRNIKRPVIAEFEIYYEAVSTEPNIIQDLSQTNPQMNNNMLKHKLSKRKSSNPVNEVSLNLPPKSEINDKQVYSKMVTINNFSNYVKQSLENGELENQFKSLPEGGTKPWNVGTSEINIKKNRYKNLTAYDHSRVVLDKIPGDPNSDFINANYVDGYKQKKAYIATQGPKKSTVNDFWRMIWQEKVFCIVMVANLVEGEKVKCEQYWPQLGNTENYGLISVTFEDTDIYADFQYRTFKVQKYDRIRQVKQYQFTSWPDHGVPLYPQSLVPFIKKLLTVSLTKAPIVVHCSAGVGRTGSIILSDICLRMAAAENQIDVYKYFHNIRETRTKMVAKYDQYLLVHMALLECLLMQQTSYPCIELSKTVEEIIRKGEIEKQIKYLKDTAWHNQVMGITEAYKDTENALKNRFSAIVPNGRRMYLSKYVSGDENEYSDYINAVPVDGFRIKNQFIVTQYPLPHTVKDFWRMITEFNVKVIVSLNEFMMNDETCSKFWPSGAGKLVPLPYLTISCREITKQNIYNIYNIKLQDSSNGDNVVKLVNIIQFKNWKYEQFIPADEQQFVDFIDVAQKLSRQDEPVVVTCYDGARASGLYVALSFVIEKIKLEQICDVCLAVRSVRYNREQFVNDSGQFEFLYKAAVQYISAFNFYSNFNPSQKSV